MRGGEGARGHRGRGPLADAADREAFLPRRPRVYRRRRAGVRRWPARWRARCTSSRVIEPCGPRPAARAGPRRGPWRACAPGAWPARDCPRAGVPRSQATAGSAAGGLPDHGRRGLGCRGVPPGRSWRRRPGAGPLGACRGGTAELHPVTDQHRVLLAPPASADACVPATASAAGSAAAAEVAALLHAASAGADRRGSGCRRPPSSPRRPAGPTTPSNGEGSSTTALAVSISTTTWSMVTLSPGWTCHLTMSASVRPSPTSGSLNCFSSPSPSPQ